MSSGSTGRTVVVTGSSGAIGAAIVHLLQSNGDHVIGVDLTDPLPALSADEFIRGDVSDDSVLTQAVDAARRAKSVWGLVHCAGTYPIVPLDDYTVQLWDRVHDVNVRAAYRLVTRLQRLIVHGGRVVLIASAAAHVGSRDVGYSASKAAVLGLMRSLAINLGDSGILVNAVCPGLIDSPMSARMSPDRRLRHASGTILGRPGTPDEVAVTVAFLLDPANSYMTGCTVDVTGGLGLR